MAKLIDNNTIMVVNFVTCVVGSVGSQFSVWHHRPGGGDRWSGIQQKRGMPRRLLPGWFCGGVPEGPITEVRFWSAR